MARHVRMPRWNFIRLHYVYVLFLTLACMVILYPARNMPAIDAFFMAASAATVTGLNTVDLKELKTYQQILVYVVPLLGQLQFIHTVVVLVRLSWFERKFRDIVAASRQRSGHRRSTLEAGGSDSPNIRNEIPLNSPNIRILHPNPESQTVESEANGLGHRTSDADSSSTLEPSADAVTGREAGETGEASEASEAGEAGDAEDAGDTVGAEPLNRTTSGHVTFSPETYNRPNRGRALRIPGPREFEKGHGVEEVDADSDDGIAKTTSIEIQSAAEASGSNEHRKRPGLNRILSSAASVEHVASSAFILGDAPRPVSRSRSRSHMSRTSSTALPPMPYLSYQPTIGRNSQFHDLTPEQRDELGGIEYRSLRLLVRILGSYYFFFHVLGAVCLVAWIYNSDMKYREYLHQIAIRPSWWAFYSAMTTFNNLGFTLTPDSMVQFRETNLPIILMVFLMWIGNTAYPCMLRFLIWIAFKITPQNSAIREPLNFLLDHPRRCYTFLFPSGPTWMLLATLVILNGLDVILFVGLDLDNPEVTSISTGWHRFLAALFQATSSRTTGTSTFALAKIHPAVQFSLMVMMYISVFPIAMSIRKTNTYEESSLGIYEDRGQADDVDETNRVSYLGIHIKKQLAFDLWYVFLGVFIILITEGDRIANVTEDAWQVSAIFFEILSAYGNVGLSLGHPDVNTSFTGQFGIVGKLVIIAMMIRGRHRGLPYELDRAIILPRERHLTDEPLRNEPIAPIRRYHTR